MTVVIAQAVTLTDSPLGVNGSAANGEVRIVKSFGQMKLDDAVDAFNAFAIFNLSEAERNSTVLRTCTLPSVRWQLSAYAPFVGANKGAAFHVVSGF